MKDQEIDLLEKEIAFVKENAAAWEKNAKQAWCAHSEASGREDNALKTIQLLVNALNAMYDLPEINPNNYDHNDVCDLNDQAINASLAAYAAITLVNELHGIAPQKK